MFSSVEKSTLSPITIATPWASITSKFTCCLVSIDCKCGQPSGLSDFAVRALCIGEICSLAASWFFIFPDEMNCMSGMRIVKEKIKKDKNLQSVGVWILYCSLFWKKSEGDALPCLMISPLPLHLPSIIFSASLLPFPAGEDAGHGRWNWKSAGSMLWHRLLLPILAVPGGPQYLPRSLGGAQYLPLCVSMSSSHFPTPQASHFPNPMCRSTVYDPPPSLWFCLLSVPAKGRKEQICVWAARSSVLLSSKLSATN